jgi:SAM-dependent methyltransferase
VGDGKAASAARRRRQPGHQPRSRRGLRDGRSRTVSRRVTGIHFVEEAIRRARSKAAARGLKVEFLLKDALTLREWDRRFATVTDFGLFHVFSDADSRRYVEGLRTVLAPGGRLFLSCFSDEQPGTEGPRRVSRQELHDAFADGFAIESIEPSQFEVNPRLSGTSFSPGGPKTWFAIIRRKRE